MVDSFRNMVEPHTDDSPRDGPPVPAVIAKLAQVMPAPKIIFRDPPRELEIDDPHAKEHQAIEDKDKRTSAFSADWLTGT